MKNIISINDYKRKHGIALPRSPYYTLDATHEQLLAALEMAKECMRKPMDYQGLPYAAIVGYENIKTGKIKLLKQIQIASCKEAISGIRGYRCIGLQQKANSTDRV